MSPELVRAVTRTCTYFGHIADMKNCIVCKVKRDKAKKSQ